jgi:hypothetical protein
MGRGRVCEGWKRRKKVRQRGMRGVRGSYRIGGVSKEGRDIEDW